MSQLGYGTSAQKIVPVAKDNFGIITTSAGTLANFTVGEIVTGGTSGCKAKVSGVISSTELRVKAVVSSPSSGALFANSETITGNKSSNTATVAGSSGFVLQNKKGSTYFNQITSNDSGLLRTSMRGIVHVMNAVRLFASKTQNTDTSVAPTLTVVAATRIGNTTSVAGTQTISKAALGTIRITVTSNEALVVTGSPTYVLNFASGTGTAVYVPSKSKEQKLVFDYVMTGSETNGAMVSAVYTAAGATITDLSGAGSNLTPDNPTVTGWTVAA